LSLGLYCRRFFRACVFCGAVVSVIAFSPLRADSGDPRAAREAAVMQARAGHAKTSLATLQRLLQQYPDDPLLLADTVVVANWAGADAVALDLYSHAATPKNNSGVTEAAARSARNLHRYAQAAELYRQAQAIDPRRWQPRLGEAMVLTDEKKYAQAAILLDPILRDHRQEKDVLTGAAYLCERKSDFACVLARDEDLLQLQPEDQAVRCQMARALLHLGGATRATVLCGHPAPAFHLEMQEALGAEYVRWGETYSPTREMQIADSTAALAKLDAVIASAAPKDAVWRAAQFDRILALTDLRRPREVARTYELLQARKVEVPTYALANVAGAYLQLHQPWKAAKLYRVLIDRSPGDGAAWSGLAYAQFESGRMGEAFATIDHAYAMAPVWLQAPGLRAPFPNRMYASLGEQAAMMRGYANLLAQEYKRQAAMVRLAPANTALRRDLALTDLARGWPERALTDSRIADSYATRDDIPSIVSAEIHEAVGQRDVVDAMLPALRRRDFDNPELRRFVRGMQFNRSWQFDAAANYGWGSGINVGANDNHSEAHLYSPLIHNRFRIYGHELRDGGDFITQTAARTRVGIGTRYNYNRKSAWAELAYDFGTDRYAVNTGVEAGLGNHWSASAEFDSDSFDVPSRALTGNTYGRSANFGIAWHQNELRSAGLHLQRVLFSDGNQRAALPATWSQRILTTPRLQGTLQAVEWSSRNSKDENRPYFNPAADFSVGPEATLNWLTWQSYNRSLTQVFDISSSPYWQKNYGVNRAFGAHYAQQWGIRDGVEFSWGVTWTTQPYDGVNEHRTVLEGAIRWGNQ
jgi:biofilm PGA synthesis protein PgaA